MKTAISIPDDLFQAAEAATRRLGMSRSELYTRAVRAYLEAHSDDSIRQRLDELYASDDSSLDPILAQLQAASITPEPW